MCGIAGRWQPDASADALAGMVHRLQGSLQHRGPDGRGAFADAAAGVILVHTRLSIRDLSPLGAQPMASADGRFVITYNGELYGTEGLKAELERDGHRFRGHSDTEVLVECVARHGVVGAAQRVEGIFAFAVWDKCERQLWLVRDRAGVKPLYVAHSMVGRGVAFGSELAALAVLGLELTPNVEAAHAFFELGYVPDSCAAFDGVGKVQPGEAWCFASAGGPPRRVTWFDRSASVLLPPDERIQDVSEAKRALAAALDAAVERQLVSDVPVGVFLSGGIDSSTVAASSRRVSRGRVRSFCVGFDDARYDESESARAIADHLGTEHHELILRPGDVVDSVRAAAAAFSEPFADSSLVPTWILCKFAREHVAVVLSGDGGDELFGGYNRHVWLPRVMTAQRLVPPWVRRRAAAGLQYLSQDAWDRVLRRVPVRMPGLKVHKLARLLKSDSASALLREVVSTGPLASGLVRGAAGNAQRPFLDLGDTRASLMFHDYVTYLPGDVLTKVDRCSMAHGLEARVPLLDEGVVALAARIHPDLKVRSGQGKWILREVLAERVPRGLFERPKMGFAIPLADWLRGPLRPWAEELLSPRALAQSPLLDASAVRSAWEGLLAGKPMMEFGVWSLLMWQQWEVGRYHGPR